jgi:hypothetical protein
MLAASPRGARDARINWEARRPGSSQPAEGTEDTLEIRLGFRSVFVAAFALALTFASARASAQSYGIGARAGIGTSVNDFDIGALDARSLEAQFHVEVEPGVLVRVRAARLHDEGDLDTGHFEADYEKVGMDVEYQHRAGWYRAGLFLGGGYYLFDDGDAAPAGSGWWVDGKDAVGIYAGVDAYFDLAPGLSLVPELSVERVKAGESRTIGTFSVGLLFTF